MQIIKNYLNSLVRISIAMVVLYAPITWTMFWVQDLAIAWKG